MVRSQRLPVGSPTPGTIHGLVHLLVRVMAMMPRMRPHHPRLAAVPIAVALIAAPVGIARAVVLAIGVGIKLRAVAGILDCFLRGCRAHQRSSTNEGGADQSKFHERFLC